MEPRRNEAEAWRRGFANYASNRTVHARAPAKNLVLARLGLDEGRQKVPMSESEIACVHRAFLARYPSRAKRACRPSQPEARHADLASLTQRAPNPDEFGLALDGLCGEF